MKTFLLFILLMCVTSIKICFAMDPESPLRKFMQNLQNQSPFLKLTPQECKSHLKNTQQALDNVTAARRRCQENDTQENREAVNAAFQAVFEASKLAE